MQLNKLTKSELMQRLTAALNTHRQQSKLLSAKCDQITKLEAELRDIKMYVQSKDELLETMREQLASRQDSITAAVDAGRTCRAINTELQKQVDELEHELILKVTKISTLHEVIMNISGRVDNGSTPSCG